MPRNPKKFQLLAMSERVGKCEHCDNPGILVTWPPFEGDHGHTYHSVLCPYHMTMFGLKSHNESIRREFINGKTYKVAGW